jgi:hypothetical protein
MNYESDRSLDTVCANVPTAHNLVLEAGFRLPAKKLSTGATMSQQLLTRFWLRN